MLYSLGFQDVEEAESADEALGLAASKHFDIVVSDLHLGEATDIDLFRRLRALEEYKAIPFILATSAPEKEIYEMAGTTNLPGVLFKPFGAKDLMATIDACFD